MAAMTIQSARVSKLGIQVQTTTLVATQIPGKTQLNFLAKLLLTLTVLGSSNFAVTSSEIMAGSAGAGVSAASAAASAGFVSAASAASTFGCTGLYSACQDFGVAQKDTPKMVCK